MAQSVEIICRECGADTLVKREPVYDGLKKSGENFLCASCGHVYEHEEDVPFKVEHKVNVFSDRDRPQTITLFEDDEQGRNCRHCRHYVLNPFIQRCGLHHREVQATDLCDDFNPPDNTETNDGEREDGD